MVNCNSLLHWLIWMLGFVGMVCVSVGTFTTHWEVHSPTMREGLWQSCNDDNIRCSRPFVLSTTNKPLNCVRVFMMVSVINAFVSTIISILAAIFKSKEYIGLVVTHTIAFFSCIVGVLVYSTHVKDFSSRWGWSYHFACFACVPYGVAYIFIFVVMCVEYQNKKTKKERGYSSGTKFKQVPNTV